MIVLQVVPDAVRQLEISMVLPNGHKGADGLSIHAVMQLKLLHIPIALIFAGSAIAQKEATSEEKQQVGSFSIAAIADVQYADADPRGAREPRQCVDRLKNAVKHYNQRDLDWGVILGDIIDWDDIDYSAYPKKTITTKPITWKHTKAVLAAWRELDCKQYLVLGNHDYYVPYKDADGLSKPASVYRAFGFKDKAYYDFHHKGFRFVVLDGDLSHNNYDIESEEYKKAKAYYDSLKGPARGIWSAGVSGKQMAWLKGVLEDAAAKKEPTVIMCHYPTHKPLGGHSLFNAEEMLALLDQYPNVVLWLNGHNHSGGYAKVGNRHHLNLKGMQEESDRWYQIDFSPGTISVYQAENTKEPVHELDISWVNQ